jgi:RNA polymerase sigma-70 factor (ECF subfamily)
MTDGQWLAAIRAGDEEAFLSFYRQHQGGIYRFALRMSGKETLAQDVTQEVFLVLLRSKEGTGFEEGRGTLIGYLFGVARHLVQQRMAREGRWLSLPESIAEEEAGARPQEVVTCGDDPLDRLTREETVTRMRRMVLTLPSHYREVIVLCDLHEMTYQQVAEVLGCSVGTVRSRLHRGRSLLAVRWQGEEQASLSRTHRLGKGIGQGGKRE